MTLKKLAWAAVVVAALATLCFAFSIFRPLKEWQDLIAGTMALAAAGLGGIFLQAQIRASEKQETRRRLARFTAARATLPLTLSAVTEYASTCAKAYGTIYQHRTERGISNNIGFPHFPELPFESVQEFRALIEHGDEIVGEPIKKLLSLMQIHRARVKGLIAWYQGQSSVTIVTTGNIEEAILMSIEIHARAALLYSFGRFLSDDAARPLTSDRILAGLDEMNFFQAQEPDLYVRAAEWTPSV